MSDNDPAKVPFPPNIKGIIFDLDGTLYQIKWYMKPLFALFLFPKWRLLTRYMSLRKKYNGKETASGDDLLRALANDLSKGSKVASSDAMHSWIMDNFYPTFIKVMSSMKGSRLHLNETLAQVKEKGYKLAVLSDFAYIKERLTGLNIPPGLFDTLLSTESEGQLKPCIGPFLSIADLWCMKPAEIVVIGDKYDTDGIGASRAGMPYIRISDSGTKPPGVFGWPAIKDGLWRLPALEN